MAARRRGWRARRLSGRGIGGVLSSPPSDGSRHAGWRQAAAVSVRTTDLFGASRDRRRYRSGRGGWRPPSAAWGAAVRPTAGARDQGSGGPAIARVVGTHHGSDVVVARAWHEAAVTSHLQTNPPTGRKSDRDSRVLHTSTRRTSSAVDVSRTAHPAVATYFGNVSDFRPTTGLVYVGSPLAAGTGPWHCTTPTPGPDGRRASAPVDEAPSPVRWAGVGAVAPGVGRKRQGGHTDTTAGRDRQRGAATAPNQLRPPVLVAMTEEQEATAVVPWRNSSEAEWRAGAPSRRT